VTNQQDSEITVWVSEVHSTPLLRGSGGPSKTGFGTDDEVELQAKVPEKLQEAVRASSEVFLSTWKDARKTVEALFAEDHSQDEDPTKQPGRFVLDEVTAKLTLSASGKVAFVGELGGGGGTGSHLQTQVVAQPFIPELARLPSVRAIFMSPGPLPSLHF
jgi:hypothetical protein